MPHSVVYPGNFDVFESPQLCSFGYSLNKPEFVLSDQYLRIP